jgi:hypothetical protein
VRSLVFEQQIAGERAQVSGGVKEGERKEAKREKMEGGRWSARARQSAQRTSDNGSESRKGGGERERDDQRPETKRKGDLCVGQRLFRRHGAHINHLASVLLHLCAHTPAVVCTYPYNYAHIASTFVASMLWYSHHSDMKVCGNAPTNAHACMQDRHACMHCLATARE